MQRSKHKKMDRVITIATAAAVAVISAVAAAAATAAPTSVPTFTGEKNAIQAPAMQAPQKPRTPTRRLYRAVEKCYPEASYFRGEIALQGRAQNTRAATLHTDGQLATGSRVNLALVVSIPLYSASEIDRERNREFNRRVGAATAIGDFVKAVADRRKSERQLELYKALESRAKERVAIGVAATEEQVNYMEKVAMVSGDVIAAEGLVEKTRLALLSQCAEGKDSHVDELISEQIYQ
jgi:hypothetical protein